MSRAHVNCIACHENKKLGGDVAAVVGQTFTATQARCDYCHGEQYKGMLDQWRSTVTRNLDRAEAAFTQAQAVLQKSPVDAVQRLRAQRLLDDAAHNIRLVKLGHGVHNVTYATAVLNVAFESSTQAARIAAGEVTEARP